MSEWWSIEVFDAYELPARRWKDSYQDELIEAALTNGAVYWEWHEHRYGVVFEVLFDSDAQWEAFRALPAVRSALDGVPDPVNGLIIYRGRGGGSGPRKPRKPKPAPSSSAMAAARAGGGDACLTWPASRRPGRRKPGPGMPERLKPAQILLPRVKHPPGRCRMGE